jgi:hypothetical protein
LVRDDIALVSSESNHRMKFGGVLHALGNYVDLDYELPYTKLFPHEKMIFEKV